MELEEYNLDRLGTIGGHTYNHSGQIIRTPDHGNKGGWLFLGDDYEDYSALDALIMYIVSYPKNFYIYGEVIKIEHGTDTYGSDIVRVTSKDDDGEVSTDDIQYEYMDAETIVNHVSRLEVRRKAV